MNSNNLENLNEVLEIFKQLDDSTKQYVLGTLQALSYAQERSKLQQSKE